MTDRIIPVGKLGKAHGIRGEILLFWYAESFILSKGKTIWLKNTQGQIQQYTVKYCKPYKSQFILSLENIINRDQAEYLVGNDVLISRNDIPNTDDILIYDLLQSDIFLENGTYIGKLNNVDFPAGNELWSIKSNDNDEILFPAIPEFVKNIDLINHIITINPPKGLIEINKK